MPFGDPRGVWPRETLYELSENEVSDLLDGGKALVYLQRVDWTVVVRLSKGALCPRPPFTERMMPGQPPETPDARRQRQALIAAAAEAEANYSADELEEYARLSSTALAESRAVGDGHKAQGEPDSDKEGTWPSCSKDFVSTEDQAALRLLDEGNPDSDKEDTPVPPQCDRRGRVRERHIPAEVRGWLMKHLAANLIRVGGQVFCEHCGRQYDDHPEIHPTFVLLCDGRLGKT